MIDEVDFFGIKISSFTETELWAIVDQDINERSSQVYYGTGFYNIVLLGQFPELHSYASKVDITLMDGHIFKLLVSFMGFQTKYEISIPQFTLKLLNHISPEKKIFILGGTKDVNKLAIDFLISDYKMINTKGRDGYFQEEEEQNIVREINEYSPDLLLIGISSPIKERFFFKWKSYLNVGIILPCGGMVDVLAKKTKVTPDWLKKLGLATPYRVMQEPGRLLWSRLNLLLIVFLKIIPILCYQKFIKRNLNYFLPGLFGIR
jgi:N-acetylglucosaminyldiphosphoundecaprenol N-acetyl-beta-D-mannosaminyltransferase